MMPCMHLLRGVLAAAAATLIAGAAFAGETGASSAPGSSGALVRGGAPLPEFHLGFPGDALSEHSDDLEISLTSPGQSALRFLFSPRPIFGQSLDQTTGTSRNTAGLSWNIFENDKLFGSFGFSGSIVRPGAEDPARHLFDPPLTLHSTLELGYQLGDQHSLSLSLDRASPSSFGTDKTETGEALRLRYGYHF